MPAASPRPAQSFHQFSNFPHVVPTDLAEIHKQVSSLFGGSTSHAGPPPGTLPLPLPESSAATQRGPSVSTQIPVSHMLRLSQSSAFIRSPFSSEQAMNELRLITQQLQKVTETDRGSASLRLQKSATQTVQQSSSGQTNPQRWGDVTNSGVVVQPTVVSSTSASRAPTTLIEAPAPFPRPAAVGSRSETSQSVSSSSFAWASLLKANGERPPNTQLRPDVDMTSPAPLNRPPPRSQPTVAVGRSVNVAGGPDVDTLPESSSPMSRALLLTSLWFSRVSNVRYCNLRVRR